MANSSIIAFAKTASDRDFLRSIVADWEHTLIFFESETICFDNLLSINPKVIIIRTDDRGTVWRFVFAMYIQKVKSALFVLTNLAKGPQFNFDVFKSFVRFHSLNNEGKFSAECSDYLNTDRRIAIASEAQEVLVGESSEILRANASIEGLSNSTDAVLITGAAGTGKELLARRIVNHNNNGKGSIFIKIDCSQFCVETMGLMQLDELKNIKTVVPRDEISEILPLQINIFFNGINHLSIGGQLEILSLLEHGLEPSLDNETAFRVIATTDADMDELIRNNQFREDLYYRLNVIPVNLPPLQQRKKDIPLLADYFSIRDCHRLRRSHLLVTKQTIEKLQAYHWPGNVDELRRAVERFIKSGDEANILAHIGFKYAESSKTLLEGMDDSIFPDAIEIRSCLSAVGSVPLKSICDKFVHQTEKVILQKALKATKWNRKKAAELLNISYKSMLNKMKIYEIV